MADRTARLNLVIAGDNKGAVTAVNGVGGALGKTEGQAHSLGGALAGAFSVGAVVAGGKKILDGYEQQAGAVAKIKRLTGESAKDSSLLAFAAQQAGVGADKAAASYGILATNIKNGKVAAQGIATKDGNGGLLSFGQILDNIADKLHALPPGFQRTAEARALFGRGGADMAKILGGGSAALEEQRKKMESLGLEFSESGLQKYDKFVHVQRDVSAAVTGVEIAIGTKLAGALSVVERAFVRLPGPVRTGVAVVGSLAAAVTALTVAAGALGPVLTRGAVALHLKAAAATEAADATTVAATADELATEAAAAAAAATEALTVALTAAGTGEAEFAAAATAAATAAEASAAAMAAEATAAEGVGAASASAGIGMGGLAKGAVAAVAGFEAYRTTTNFLDSHFASFHGSTTQLERDLSNVGKGADDVSTIFDHFGGSVGSLAHKIKQANSDSLGNRIAKPFNTADVRQANADISALTGTLTDLLDSQGPEVAGKAYGAMVRQLEAAGVSAEDIAKQFAPFIAALLSAKKGAKDAGDAVKGTASDIAHFGEVLKAQKIEDAGKSLFDLQQSAAQAGDSLASAYTDLATAQKAERGESDEYRAALKQEKDDQKAVTSAVKDVAQARKDEATAIENAKRHLDDLRQSVISTGIAERDAQLAKDEAVAKARATLADPRATALEREQAQVALADATDQVTIATQNHAQAEADSAKATIANDAGVVAAKQKVQDAIAKVGEAEAKVAEDGKAKSKILHDAVLTVRDAQNKVNDALLTQVDTNAKLEAAQKGPLAGQLAYAQGLLFIYKSLDPNSPLAVRVGMFLQSNNKAIALANAVPGIGTPAGPNVPPTRNPDAGPTVPGKPIPGNQHGRSIGGGVTVVNVHQGTPTQTRRAMERSANRSVRAILQATR